MPTADSLKPAMPAWHRRTPETSQRALESARLG
jgi:hypothetical protein